MDKIEQTLKEMGLDTKGLKKELEGKSTKNKRTYLIYIKSHTKAPDFEMAIDAENVVKALKELKYWLSDWEDIEILEYISFPEKDLAEEDKVIIKLFDRIKELETENIELKSEQSHIRKKLEEIIKTIPYR